MSVPRLHASNVRRVSAWLLLLSGDEGASREAPWSLTPLQQGRYPGWTGPVRGARGPLALAARSRRPGDGQSPLPPSRTDKPDRRDTIILDAVVFDVQIDPGSQLHLGALQLLLIKKFPAAGQNHHRGDAIAPLAQIGRIAKDVDMIPQQAVVVEGHNLRDLSRLRGHGGGGRLLGSRRGGAE